MLKSLRLMSALAFVNPEFNYADIGADHGYLAKAMLDTGVKLVQVVENKPGPLEHAKCNLQGDDNVIYSLSDGLKDLDERIDAVTICGMGGLNIIGIINDCLAKAKTLKQLILQANSKIYELRQFLNEQHFQIENEKIVYEQGKYYEIIACRYDTASKSLSEAELRFGPCLMKEKSQVFIAKYYARYLELTHTLSLLHEEHTKKKQEITDELALIDKLELNYENN